jgi:hypothetical protein
VLAIAEYAVRSNADAAQLGEQFGDVNRVEDLPEYVTRVAGHDTTMGHDELHHWWTKGPGLARWIGSDHQFYTLREQLVKATDGKVPVEVINNWAAAWVHEVTGLWPGSDAHRVAEGHEPRGHRVGPG